MHFPPYLVDPVSHVAELLQANKSRYLIALAGLPGSGKTTLARSIEEKVNASFGQEAIISLGMDGFHLTKAALRLMPDPEYALSRRGAPWTFDANALAARLQLVRSEFRSSSVNWPGFEHGVGDPVEDQLAIDKNVQIVLVEGLYLLYNQGPWSNVTSLFDERWFLDTPRDIADERLTLRHMKTRSITRKVAVERIYNNDRLNADLTFATRQLGDWRVQ